MNVLGNNFAQICLLFTVASTIVGCSSNSDEPNASNANSSAIVSDTASPLLKQLGNILIIDNEVSGTVINADFIQFESDVSQWFVVPEASTTDVCVVDFNFERPSAELQEKFENSSSISAGEALVLSSPAGTFATLIKQTEGSNIEYDLETTLQAPTTGMTLDIPGDDFPALANISIPAIPIFEIIDFPVVGLTESSTYTWVGSSNPNHHITFSIGIDRFTEDARHIDCTVWDDGKFTLPAETIAEVGRFDDGSIYSANSNVLSITRSGVAMLMVLQTARVDLP